MRFGLHLADVLVENDDLIGDGVNLAARIQQAADPDAVDVRLRGPNGARDEFLLAATAQNLRKLAKLIPMPSAQPA